MAITNAIASLAVKDLSVSIKWYEQLFDRAADSRPMPEVAEWKFSGGGWLQIYQLPERAGACSATLAVENIDDQIAKLESLKINTGERPANSKVKTVMITDLDGNHIAFAQTIDQSMAK